MKKVAIVGAGEIGAFIAERLAAEQFEVTVIDHNPMVLANLRNTVDVAGFLGNATSLRDLTAAEIRDADLLIATTNQDETNLVACLLAKELKIPYNIAVTRYLGFRGQRSPFNSQQFGIDVMINSSEAVRNEVMEVIESRGASEVGSFADGQIILIGYQVESRSDFCGKTVADVSKNDAEPLFHLATIVRHHTALPPAPKTLIQEGDYLYLTTIQRHLPDVNALLNVEALKSRTAVICGGNFLSEMLAGALLNRHFSVTMLVENGDKALMLKEHFRARRHFHVEVGSGLDMRLQRRVKVPATAVFVASTRDDATNITACMVAKHLGVSKTVAMIKRNDMLSMCRHAGVDIHIAPRLATAKLIQKVVHENRVLDYKAVAQTNLEVVELETAEHSRVLKGRLKDLRLPEGAVVGGVFSAGVPALPNPEHTFKAGDRVVILTPPEHILEVETLFASTRA